jgi:hypothetical protein
MIRTSKKIEEYITPLFKLLNYPINTPKWIALRFMINISLSLKEKDYTVRVEEFDGKEYRLTQITGENKEDEDFTHQYHKMIEAYDDITFKSKKEFERKLEYHICRGYTILNYSLKANSNIYEFLLQDFSLEA